MADFIVDTTVDENDGIATGGVSLRDAIAEASGNGEEDTITFADGPGEAFENGGTITLDAAFGALVVDSDVVIQGPGADLLTIDADQSSRVFTIFDGSFVNQLKTVEISGLTITGGNGVGTGVTLLGAGGIDVIENLTLTDVVVTGNTTTSGGGGIGVADGVSLTLERSVVSDNMADTEGGGIRSGVDTVLVITDSTVSGNEGPFGGGIFSETPLTISGSTISGNTATTEGGGLWFYSGVDGFGSPTGSASISNSTISGNTSPTDGGGIFAAVGLIELSNSTVTDNTALDGGAAGIFVYNGGFYVAGGYLEIASSIVAENNGADFGLEFANYASTITDGGNNLIGNADGISDFTVSTLVGSAASPIDPMVGTLQNNGGPTETHALQQGSPAIDAGANPDNLTTDQRGAGFPRDINGIDIGAFEAPAPLALVVDTVTDEADGSVTDGDVSLRDALAFIGEGGTITFASGPGEAFENDATIRLVQALGPLTLTSDLTIDGSTAGGTVTITGDSDNSGTRNAADTQVFSITGGTATLQNLDIAHGFSTDAGGAVYAGDNTTLNLTDSIVRDSYAANFGGGIFSRGDNLNVTASTISGNAGDFGGGIYNSNSYLNVSDSTISGNQAETDGGGIQSNTALAGAIGIISNSTIANNMADVSGGGIQNFDGLLQIRNSTITGNTANQGGGVASVGDIFTQTEIVSSLIAGNTNNDDVRVAPNYGTVSFTSLGNNVIGGGDASVLAAFNQTGDQTGITNPMVGPLQNNGGPTETVALLQGSPAINAGSNPDVLTTDQRGAGFPRDIDGIDVGAFEQVAFETPGLEVTTTDDDIDNTDGETSLREAIAFANSQASTDTITFASGPGEAFENGGTITLDGALGELILSSDLTIDGSTAGGTVTISGDSDNSGTRNAADTQIFRISASTVTLETLDIAYGVIVGGLGGAIFVESYNTLNLNNSTVRDSYALTGGGIYNSIGTLNINESTINGNHATNHGGGISTNTTMTGTTATISNSTIANNTAGMYGGGIFNLDGLLQIRNSTITGNTGAANLGGGVASYGYINPLNQIYTQTEIVSSLIAGNTNDDDVQIVGGDTALFISLGNNVVGGGDAESLGAFNQSGDQTGVTNPMVGPLQNNGGPTETVALLQGSPAINAGSNPDGLTNDQRGAGFPRISGTDPDAGAFEITLDTPGLEVTTTDDDIDNTDGDTSLREAIAFANSQAGTDTITFASGAGEAFENNATIRLDQALGPLTLTSDVTINGSTTGGTVTISGDSDNSGTRNAADTQVFSVTAGTANLQHLDIAHGFTDDRGGAVNVGAGSTLNLSHSTVRDSYASSGGGISTTGSLNLFASTISGNQADRNGGGIRSNTDLMGTTATISNSTIASNTAGDSGGGIYSVDGLLQVRNSTITSNTAGADQGSGVASYGDTVTQTEIVSSLIAGNTNDDDVRLIPAAGTVSFVSLGNNVIGGGGAPALGVFNQTGDQTGVTNPMVGPLQNNGGPTETVALLPGSPAINAGSNPDNLTTDQRGAGFPRDIDGIDAGAFEAEAVPSVGALIDADFNSGSEGFVYSDDLFRGTNQPAFADGGRVTSGGVGNTPALRMELGGINGTDVFDPGMSGGFEIDFTLDQATDLTLSFFYRHDMSGSYESDEFSEVLVSLTNGATQLIGLNGNDFIERLFGDAGPSTPRVVSEDRVSLDLGTLAAGAYTLALGGRNNKKTTTSENTILTFDDVLLEETDTTPSDAIIDADFEGGSDGFVYSDDLFRGTSQPAFADGGRVASGGASGSAALEMELGGINTTDIFDPGMSGGFETEFTLTEATNLTLSFFFRLDMSGSYEADEFSEVLVSLTNGTTELFGRDGNDFIERLTGDGGSSTPRVVSQDTVTLDLGVQQAGTYTLALGGRNNKKTTTSENTIITFDNVMLETSDSPAPSSIIDADFSSGLEGFAYRDDAFRNTSQPAFADGGRETSGGASNSPALVLELGGINGNDVFDPGMSGGFDTEFTLNAPTQLTLSFFYRLDMSGSYESDEFSEVLVSLTENGTTELFGQNGDDFIDRLFGDAGPSTPRVVSEDVVVLDLGVQEAGDYTLTLGGRNNKKTTTSENTLITFDDVLLIEGTPDTLTALSEASAITSFDPLERDPETFETDLLIT